MSVRKQGVQRVEWRKCDRCGFLYPITQLRRQQGLLVCTEKCVDDLSPLYRPKMIADVLSQPGEGTSEQGEMFKDPGENVVF